VYDKETQEIIVGAKVHLIDASGKIIERRISDVLGAFSFGKLDCNLEYTISGEQEDYESDVVNFLTKKGEKLPVNISFELKASD